MEIKQFLATPEGKKLRIPKKVIYHYLSRKLISNPLSEDDRLFLSTINTVWTDRATIGAMLKRHTYWDRELLAATWDLTRTQTRIFGYGLFGIHEKVEDEKASGQKAEITSSLVKTELVRCGYGSQKTNVIKNILRRATEFPQRLKRRFKKLICPHCQTELELNFKAGEKPEMVRWELIKRS